MWTLWCLCIARACRLRCCASVKCLLDKEGVEATREVFLLRVLVCESCWLAHAKRYVDDMIERFGLTKSSLVGEVAANDGYLLQFVRERGISCYSIEPTANTANAARQ